MNILEAITSRHSVRTFNGAVLTNDNQKSLAESIKEATDPFGGDVTIRLAEFDIERGYRPSTYGMIKGARNFFLIATKADNTSALSAGFRFQKIVLKAWQLGLGCCWIAATFKGSDFDRDQQWPDGEELKIVCPVGTAARPTLMNRLVTTAFGSRNRKQFDSLFFLDDFSRPVPPDNRFHEALAMIRLAPSSTNSQPWRALVTDDTVHFYYKPASHLSVLDCGIGLCHFHETERFHGREGRFHHYDQPPLPPSNWKYLTSYTSAH